MSFKEFAAHVASAFAKLSDSELFIAGSDRYALELRYLAAFPDGTNPVYKTNTEHDCTCCKQFLRNLGSVVTIDSSYQIHTLWDDWHLLESPYREVSQALSVYVRSLPITGIFRTTENKFGAETTKQLTDDRVINWNHFHSDIPAKFRTSVPEAKIGEYRTAVEMLEVALLTFTATAVEDVVRLIDGGHLYRGSEFGGHVRAFQKLLKEHSDHPHVSTLLFCWKHGGDLRARFKNTVIGTLVTDLSEGMNEETAVARFESKVAPTNYKRTTALITPGMIKAALETLDTLGLKDATNRRLARLSDVSVNNVLWVSGHAKDIMQSPIEAALLSAVRPKSTAKPKDTYAIESFVSEVLPSAKKLQLKVMSQHSSNFMTLTAPVFPELSKKLFKWDNGFGWSYDGGVTDSIKEKVKRAGGNVDAKLRMSLAWYNFDDLDIHCHEPNGNHIYFGRKDGKLDVDMNISPNTRSPVENISWTTPQPGTYELAVHSYNKRETSNTGFMIEMQCGDNVTHMSYPHPVSGMVKVASILLSPSGQITACVSRDPKIVMSGMSVEKWGVKTETFVDVDTVLLSPNFWDDNHNGNKHWFFILNGCKNLEPTRGLYNEFLSNELDKHRKVFEVLGDKMKCAPEDKQMSGLGFSSTKRDTVTLSVDNRVVNVTF